MAFKLNTFVKDQVTMVKETLSPTNVIDRVTPRQVKQILNSNPVNSINKTLENISGAKIGQFFVDTGKQFLSQVNDFVSGSITQLQAQVAGCINKAIKDILDKNPILEKILFFDQFINRELSKIKNKLESKIDLELRKIAYKKIKVHQVVLFKQKIAGAIKKICPDATPASPSQVRQYKELLNKVKDKFKNEGKVEEEPQGENFTKSDLNNTATVSDTTQTKKQITDISPTVKKQLKEDPVKREEYQQKMVDNAVTSIKKQADKQVQGQLCATWKELHG
tara:strand:+ start:1184 stop:2020 length:837 start_codon:yes stop_codon:yes gene_type:complete